MKKGIFSFLMVLVFFAGVAFAGTIDLPRTGQTKCWNVEGVEIPCAGTGQDGEIRAGVAWPDPRFTDNGDETVTDNLTGLMWTKDASLSNASMTWQAALAYCNNLTFAGHSDWRLPNLNELTSLFNANEAGSEIWLEGQGFANIQSVDDDDAFFSSTTWVEFDVNDAYVIYMYRNDITVLPKTWEFRVWPIRAGQCGQGSVICLPRTGQTTSYATGDDGDLQMGVAWPEQRFTDNPDGTVTDKFTGLMWAKYAKPPRLWQQALKYVAGMNKGIYKNYGHTDWRLPNLIELLSFNDVSETLEVPAGHLPYKPDQHEFYWSSTTYPYWPNCAWFASSDGYFDPTSKPRDAGNRFCVWPVRGGQVKN